MLKGFFIKAYANLPDDVRREVIVVIDKRPYSWNSAYIEVNNNTELGKQILKKMEKMGLLKNE